MTRISRIVLHGFKSFADRIAIPLASGFNVICGPNGSGKSNLVEAILFALGVSTARQIRAPKLEQLIFHGTKNRNPAKYCVVSIYLDNSDGKLPGGEEIKISRKVTQKGLSIFRLDGKVVTRSKLLDFLANANISPYGYNIIMQGDINKIIEMSPTERREIISQLAGIQEFDEKKHKAMLELEKVERHINEMQIIAREKSALLQKLMEEAMNAERYERLNEEAKKLRASILKLELERKRKRLEKAREKTANLEAELQNVSKELEAASREMEEFLKQSGKLAKEIVRLSRNYELRRKIDAVKTELIRKKDELRFLELELGRIKTKDKLFESLSSREGVIATLEDLLIIPPKYELAFEVALGSRLRSIVVENENVAIACIEELKQKKLGRARFLPLDRIRFEREIPKLSVGRAAIELVRFEPKYEHVVKYVLGNLVVVDSLEEAKELRGFRVVTVDGDLVEPSGEYIGGHIERGELLARKRELEAKREELRADIDRLEQELAELEKKESEEAKGIEKIEKERSAIERELTKLRKKVFLLQTKKFRVSEKLSRLRIEEARLETELKNLERSLSELEVEPAYEGQPAKLKERLKRVMQQLRAIGPVNLRAKEELEVIRVEYEELQQRIGRLESERQAILRTIEEIEQKRYDKFMETLNEISKHFSQIYRDLMGGEAKLRLEDETNLESGLVIEASKAGKRFVSIDSMSGGEKTLTALAFLFALQRYKALPFYILDEVDAALDKVNSRRVAEFIKKYSKETQFIVVSHNDITISYADAVFGVALQDGVSKVFSIKLPAKTQVPLT